MKIKILFFSILFFAFGAACFSQDFSQLKNVPLKEKTDFKSAEKKVLECANYLISIPIDNHEEGTVEALKFVFNWMTGTPDYSFAMDDSVGQLLETNRDLLGVYLAYSAKIALENKGEKIKAEELSNKAIRLVLDYCKKTENKVPLNDKLKKMMEKGTSSI